MTAVFGAESTSDEVLGDIDLTGRRFLVTGVSAGIGVETARSLAARGANVIGAVRDLDKARNAARGVIAAAKASGGGFDLIQLDLASLASVRAAADTLVADGRSFDAVIANAAVMACPFGKTADGFEMQFGTNHLGHFVFVNRIAHLIRAGGRLVNLSSGAHRNADVDLADPGFETTPYDPWIAYGRSKTANVLFTLEFDRRHKARGVRAAAVHPGSILTELNRHMDPAALQAVIDRISAGAARNGEAPFSYKSIPQGAATSLWAALVGPPDAIGGRYCEDCHVAEPAANLDARTGVKAHAMNADTAAALWAKSEEMVGERFA